MKISFQLLVEKKNYLRYDMLPYIFLYLGLVYWYLELEYEDDEVYPKIGFIAVAFLHCLTYLLGHWSVRAKSIIQYDKITGKKTQKNLEKSTMVHVIYYPKQRSPIHQIVQLLWEVEDKENKPFIHFMEKKYIFDNEKQEFYRLKPNTTRKIEDIENNLQDLEQNLQVYDKNILEIPMKKFNDILREQLMEPFSFFQIFSVSLWLMDENRIYAIMTLGLLFMSACTVVIQRLRTMLMLRGMQLHPQYITVYRKNKWEKINSDDIVPGDICIIEPTHKIKQVDGYKRETDEEFLKREIPMSNKLPPKFFKTENVNVESHKQLPCDFLLLNGSCVVNEAVLTGESVPQIKDSIEKTEKQANLDNKGIHKNSMLFCGTEVIQTFPSSNYPPCIKTPPSNGQSNCLAIALRTGFDTSKGKLIRTVLHNNENLQIKQTDALVLILILLIFSIMSSAYVLMHGLEDEDRSKNKLFLRCILIITTVVPPELPMILTISVNTSLLYLQKKKIFCTEPFRIPFGGKINVLAFDKTGTLTSDSLNFKGIIENLDQFENLEKKEVMNDQTSNVLAGCHSLLLAEGKLTGDPIELLFFQEFKKWQYSTQERVARYGISEKMIKIQNTFTFRSDLKRMSTLTNVFTNGISKKQVLCKGAPEVIQQLLIEVPSNYEKAYKFYTKQGYRVLSLAYKILDNDSNLDKIEREEAEKDLIFAGLLITESPLKHDTLQQIKKLQDAAFKILMITGDNILTAISIGKKLSLGQTQQNKDYNYLSIEYNREDKSFYYLDQHEKIIKFEDDKQNLAQKAEQNVICITGSVIKALFQQYKGDKLANIIQNITIFARTSPQQKELVILVFRGAGQHVLMCGDGTNDVGALKKSDMGIALVGMQEESLDVIKERKLRKKEIEKKRLQNPREYMKEMNLFESEVNYKFGDACIAAPFTSKNSASIRCVLILLRQGICTLVTTIQTYKILTISSLIQAYTLSVLHMEALKFSEFQYTILGMSAAFCYFKFSNSKPLKKIAPERPVGTIFEIYFIVSVIGQVALHLYGTYESTQIGIKYSTKEDLQTTHDEEFKPTFLNTAVFLYSMISQTCSFLFNNGGEPHMEGFQKNKGFLKALLYMLGMTFVLTLNLAGDLGEYLELKFNGIDQQANMELFQLFCIVVGGNYILETGCRYFKFKKLHHWI